jgi:hexulose-6-phosphate isomerase
VQPCEYEGIREDMAMKIGITQIVISRMSLDECLDLCKEAGYEAMELSFREGGELDINMGESEIRKVGEKCAAALGVDGMLLHPGQLTSEGTYQDAWDGLLKELKELAPVAESHKVAIGVENVWNKFLLSPKEMREFVDAVGSNWVGTYLDTANMMAYGYPEHWIRELGKRIKKVHFKDFKRREHRFVNLLDGDTDWPLVMKEFRNIGYDSYVIHEVGGDHETLVDLGERMRKIIAM